MSDRKSNVCPTGKNRQNKEEKNGLNFPELMKSKNPDLQEAREKEKASGRKERSPTRE